MAESILDEAGRWLGGILDKGLDVYQNIEMSKHETNSTQLPASVGVTEPVTQPDNTAKNTGISVSSVENIDNKILMVGGGAFVLLLLVVLLKK
ncbi:hypothetical protein [Marinomonas sp. 2405UD68-3]|uniref:hypothetical protein n=1 Tax=Marinomonas sp. 2405UD68-3 TaxID=3391835 RepID=UPI0039C903C7